MTFRNVSTEIEEEIKIDKTLDEVLKKLKTIDCNQTFMGNLDLPVLTPSQINLFFNIQMKEKKGSLGTGGHAFLKELIYNSWNYGYNDFKLNNLKSGKVNYLLSDFKGDNGNPISITFNGNGGYNFAMGSKNCIYNVSGEFGYNFSNHSNNCIYNIDGEIKGTFLGKYVSNTYNLFKNIKKVGERGECMIRDCTFNIYEGIDEIIWESISDCTFRTPDSKTYEKIVSSLREYKSQINQDISSKENGYEKTRNSFKEDSNLLKGVFFQKYDKKNKNYSKYIKIQLIK